MEEAGHSPTAADCSGPRRFPLWPCNTSVVTSWSKLKRITVTWSGSRQWLVISTAEPDGESIKRKRTRVLGRPLDRCALVLLLHKRLQPLELRQPQNGTLPLHRVGGERANRSGVRHGKATMAAALHEGKFG